MMGEPFHWGAWSHLDHTIRTGQPTFDHVFGETLFAYLGQRPQEAEVFNNAMTGMTARQVPAILAAYDFSECSRIVDVGGGQGGLLRAILERYPQTTGVLADLPTVVDDARELRGSAVADLCEFVGIDMFRSVPASGDTYLLKSILHDWNDAGCLQILRPV
jgi:hypothetical protein